MMTRVNGALAFDASEIRLQYRGTPATFDKCDALAAEGYMFIPGNAPYMDKAKKWDNYSCIRVAQTNSKKHGYCIATLWAVRPKGLGDSDE